ncbi:polyprotein [Sesamum angolense]|uniref:Polyprotein n=1 Tax=Sesamum angolense TaxID=2727404 RepID=A0AAE1T5X8_9LAMI|nr:polyprotein [Sesamum angolense]
MQENVYLPIQATSCEKRRQDKKKSLRLFRRRPFRKKKTDRCYLCGKKGHFARRCPNKKEKSAKMVSQISQISETTLDDTDIESLYSEQDEQTEDTIFAIHDISYDEEDEHSSVEERDDPQSYLPIYMMQANSTVDVTIPAPQVEIQILQSPYDKPIKAIGFIDIGATKTMLNPEVLPDDAWRTHYEYFQAVDGQRFSTSLITKKPIGIRFFPECIIWMHVIGSKLHGRDLLIDAPAPYVDIANKLQQCCADSHADFKHPHPLWKNPEFFIQLPFKLNEDANPIKASHPGTTPDDLVLAREECNQLLALELQAGAKHAATTGENPMAKGWRSVLRIFFRKVAMRRATKRVFQIMNETGRILTEHDEVVDEFVSFYQRLLGEREGVNFLI